MISEEEVPRPGCLIAEKLISFIPQNLYTSMVDEIESALHHYRAAGETQKFEELNKRLDRTEEKQHSHSIDQNIRTTEPTFSTTWFRTTESLVAVARKHELIMKAKSNALDNFVHTNAQRHLEMNGGNNFQYFNQLGICILPDRELRLPVEFPSSEVHHSSGLVKLPNEVLINIYRYLDVEPNGGRGALALTCRELATASKLVEVVRCPPTLSATFGATVENQHRFCQGCSHMRSVNTSYWAAHAASICQSWYTYGHSVIFELSPIHFGLTSVRYPAFWRHNEDVRRWCNGMSHTHGPPGIPARQLATTPINSRPDMLPCFARSAFEYAADLDGARMPLCPMCAAQHTWELHETLDLCKRGKNIATVKEWVEEDRTYTGALQALWWRRQQFLADFPAERARFPSAGQIEIMPESYFCEPFEDPEPPSPLREEVKAKWRGERWDYVALEW